MLTFVSVILRQILQFDIAKLDPIAFRFQPPIAFGNLGRREFTGHFAH